MFLLACGGIAIALSVYDIAVNPFPAFRSFYLLPVGVVILGIAVFRLLRRRSNR